MFRMLFIILFAIPNVSRAYSLISNSEELKSSYLLAQSSDGGTQNIDEESFDPFSDYSEFDETSDEEADINFFRNGRFLTVGFTFGSKAFTGNLSQAYSSTSTYGFFLAYFFDMRFAFQLAYSTADTSFSFSDVNGQSQGGNVSFGHIQIAGKYYINTQNISKGIAELNPYTLVGVSSANRVYTLSSVSGSSVNSTASAWGLDAGGGLEVPILRKKAYAGLQFIFHYVNFSDSNSPFPLTAYSTTSAINQTGYQYDIAAVLGINF